MEITYYGAGCVQITMKRGTVVVDGALHKVGLKDLIKKEAIQLATQDGFAPENPAALMTIDMPGEYEVQGISMKGVQAKRLLDHDESQKAIMYQIRVEDTVIAVLGHVAYPLSEEQLEALGIVDVLIIPVGGGGYTLDAHQAATTTRQIDPKIVIPVHYAESGVNYEVPQESLEAFIKELSVEHETVDKLKLKTGLPDNLKIVELTRQK